MACAAGENFVETNYPKILTNCLKTNKESKFAPDFSGAIDAFAFQKNRKSICATIQTKGKKMKLLMLLPVLALGALVSCTSKTEKRVEKDIAQQNVSTTAQASDSGRQAIVNSDKLSSEQKQALLLLMGQAQAEMANFRKTEAQIKSSLFKYLASGSFEESEISTYRKKLKDLEDQKMDLMFKNVKETRKILGKEMKFDPDFLYNERFSSESL